MQDAKEEVRARLNIEDVVGEYVQLKRAGRNFKGLSPFTSEKTPSFTVSPEKHIWHDFSSGKGGDIFSFVMEVEGIDFRAALEQLARKAGIDLSQYDSKQSGEIAAKKKRLHEANELAARYFQNCLLKNKHALDYVVKTRKLGQKTIGDFRIGYAPDTTDSLISLLKKRGFSAQELSSAGLANRRGGDLFRGRMSVPLMDGAGQIIGFTGRILRDVENAPKYLNTPATLIYDKSRHVFGLSQAKEAIRKADQAVIVEGNMDVVSSHQAGIKNVVATAGTAMTEQHLRALVRLTSNIRLAFDSDKAGLAATERAIPIAQTVGVELSIVTLPDGAKDPDELIQKDVSAWQSAIDSAKPVVDWVLEQYSAREDMTSAAGKRRFTTTSLDVVRALHDPVEKEHYLKKIADMSESSLETVRTKSEQRPHEEAAKKAVKPSTFEPIDQSYAYQDDALAVLIEPAATQLRSQIVADEFHGEERRTLAEYLQSHPDASIVDTPPHLQSIDTYVKIVLLRAETRYANWTDSDIELEAARLLRQIRIEHKKQAKNDLMVQLQSAEADGDELAADALRQQLANLIKEMARG